MVDATKSACINHHEMPAVTRCKRCNTPVCGMCIVKGANGHFCSEACKEQYAQFIERADKLEKRGWGIGFMTKLKYFLIKLILLVILFVAIGFGAIKFNVRFVSDIAYWVLGLFGY